MRRIPADAVLGHLGQRIENTFDALP